MAKGETGLQLDDSGYRSLICSGYDIPVAWTDLRGIEEEWEVVLLTKENITAVVQDEMTPSVKLSGWSRELLKEVDHHLVVLHYK